LCTLLDILYYIRLTVSVSVQLIAAVRNKPFIHSVSASLPFIPLLSFTYFCSFSFLCLLPATKRPLKYIGGLETTRWDLSGALSPSISKHNQAKHSIFDQTAFSLAISYNHHFQRIKFTSSFA